MRIAQTIEIAAPSGADGGYAMSGRHPSPGRALRRRDLQCPIEGPDEGERAATWCEPIRSGGPFGLLVGGMGSIFS